MELGELEQHPMIGEFKQEPKKKRSGCCRQCCVFLGAAFLLYVILLSSVCTMSLFMKTPQHCAVEDYGLDTLPKPFPMPIGTSITIADNKWPVDTIDLTGIWWLRWVDASGALRGSGGGGDASGADQLRGTLISFAGSERLLDGIEGDTEFASTKIEYPMVLKVPMQAPGSLGFRSTWSAWAQRLFDKSQWDEDAQLVFGFTNQTFARVNDAMALAKENEDKWVHSADGSSTPAFELVRVVDETGLAVKTWWPELQKYMSGTSLRIWGADGVCERKCELGAMSLLVPASTSCKLCKQMC